MRSLLLRTTLVLAAIASLSVAPSAEKAVASATSGTGPAFKAIGPMTFGPDGLLFAADAQSAAIFALELGQAAHGRRAGREGDRRRSTSRLPRSSAPTCARSPSPISRCIRRRTTRICP